MAAPILWAPRISVFFLQENLHVHKIPRFRGGEFWVGGGGGGEVPILFLGRWDFSEIWNFGEWIMWWIYGANFSVNSPPPQGKTGLTLVAANFTTFFIARKEVCHLQLTLGDSSPNNYLSLFGRKSFLRNYHYLVANLSSEIAMKLDYCNHINRASPKHHKDSESQPCSRNVF